MVSPEQTVRPIQRVAHKHGWIGVAKAYVIIAGSLAVTNGMVGAASYSDMSPVDQSQTSFSEQAAKGFLAPAPHVKETIYNASVHKDAESLRKLASFDLARFDYDDISLKTDAAAILLAFSPIKDQAVRSGWVDLITDNMPAALSKRVQLTEAEEWVPPFRLALDATNSDPVNKAKLINAVIKYISWPAADNYSRDFVDDAVRMVYPNVTPGTDQAVRLGRAVESIAVERIQIGNVKPELDRVFNDTTDRLEADQTGQYLYMASMLMKGTDQGLAAAKALNDYMSRPVTVKIDISEGSDFRQRELPVTKVTYSSILQDSLPALTIAGDIKTLRR